MFLIHFLKLFFKHPSIHTLSLFPFSFSTLFIHTSTSIHPHPHTHSLSILFLHSLHPHPHRSVWGRRGRTGVPRPPPGARGPTATHTGRHGGWGSRRWALWLCTGVRVRVFFLSFFFVFIYLFIIFEEVGLFVMKILLMNFKENKMLNERWLWREITFC